MIPMVEEVDHDNSLLWNDDQSWAFPVLPVEDNDGKILIDSGKILTDAGLGEQQPERVNEGVDKGKKRSVVAGNGSGESDDHELHIWTERERRKKMRNMFASLHALIPHLHPRADKSTIIDEAVIYIKKLQLTLDNLEKQKEEKLKGSNAYLTGCDIPSIGGQSREAFMAEQGSTSQQPPVTLASLNASFTTWSCPNVVVNVCGVDAHINIVCSPTKPGMMTYLMFMMGKYNLDLVSAHVSSDPTTRIYMVHFRANGVPQQFPEAASFLVEETYKQVAAELMLWINS